MSVGESNDDFMLLLAEATLVVVGNGRLPPGSSGSRERRDTMNVARSCLELALDWLSQTERAGISRCGIEPAYAR